MVNHRTTYLNFDTRTLEWCKNITLVLAQLSGTVFITTFKNLRNYETIDVDHGTRSLAYSNHLMEQKKKCKTSYKLELWKRIKVTDCENKKYLLEKRRMVCYIDCKSTYLSKTQSDVYTIIQTLAITRDLLITFLCYTITV